MSTPLLLKGFEVEMYTGRADGTVVGCSAEAAAALAGFMTEPDQRNLEYVTPPEASYPTQLELLLEPRRRLRRWLQPRQLTLLPGSTLSLGDSRRFERSDPDNAYHAYIEATYGTRVVTASVHINLGLTDMDALFAGLRLLRCEASLLLALSASSPSSMGWPPGPTPSVGCSFRSPRPRCPCSVTTATTSTGWRSSWPPGRCATCATCGPQCAPMVTTGPMASTAWRSASAT